MCSAGSSPNIGGRGGGGGLYTILVIGDWPVLFLVKHELAIFKNVNCDWVNSGDW